MSPALPPPDPHEATDAGPARCTDLPGPTAVFLPGADHEDGGDATVDAVLDLRPGLLFICPSG